MAATRLAIIVTAEKRLYEIKTNMLVNSFLNYLQNTVFDKQKVSCGIHILE